MSCFAVVALVLHLLISLANASNRGDQYNQHRKFSRKSFQWEATLDKSTGVASSQEESKFQYKYKYHHGHHRPASAGGRRNCNIIKNNNNKNDDDADNARRLFTWIKSHGRSRQSEQFARQIFSNYPKFLERASLTAGLCRLAVSSSLSVSSLECRLLQLFNLPPTLLTFGMPRLSRPLPTPSNFSDNDGLNEDHGGLLSASSPRPQEKLICSIEIPIVGGLLAHVEATPSISAWNSPKNIAVEHGYLRFNWFETKCSNNRLKKKKKNSHNNHHHQKNQLSPQQQQRLMSQSEIRIITQIGGLYRPTIAGPALPVPKWRHCIYCSTQRIFHAHVMRRFHGHVMKEYSSSIISSERNK